MEQQPKKTGSTVAAQPVMPVTEPLLTMKGFSSMIKIVEHTSNEMDGTVNNVENILATLQAKDFTANIPLRKIRSSHSNIITNQHVFIFPDGSPASEDISLGTYFDYINESIAEAAQNTASSDQAPESQPEHNSKANAPDIASDEDQNSGIGDEKKAHGDNEKTHGVEEKPKITKEEAVKTHLKPALDSPVSDNQKANETVAAEKPKFVERKIHLRGPALVPKTASSVLNEDSFVINVVEWAASQNSDAKDNETRSGPQSKATIQSATLAESNIADMTLKELRKKLSALSPMSATSTFHKFCTAKGVPVTDETLKFCDYLKLESTKVAKSPEIASVTVFYRISSQFSTTPVDLTKLPGAYDPNTPVKVKEDAFGGMNTAKTFAPTERPWDMSDVAKSGSAISSRSAAELTEKEWPVVISQCGLMYGWVVDRTRNEIVRARKPAFQLRNKEVDNPAAMIPDFLRELADANDLQAEADSIKKFKGKYKGQALGKNGGQATPENSLSNAQNNSASRRKGDDDSTATTLAPNTSTDNSRQLAAPQSQTIPGSIPGTQDTIPDDEVVPDSEEVASGPNDGRTSRSADPTTGEAPESSDSAGSANDDYHNPQNTISCKIPNFLVNDDSKVEVVTVAHEFERSMATNDFSNKSIEGSMSGGFAGFAATISGGVATSNSNSDVKTKNEFQKTMVAKYLFPRADVMLHPENIEPSEQLKDAIERVAKTNNVRDLRALMQDFGQLFCQKVTLGGRLQSTKIMVAEEGSSEQVQKEQFKASVGLQISTPFGFGAGMKTESETGRMNATNTKEINKRETHVFEAVGGETILASTPDLWIPSVAAYKNWRVIKRDDLLPLVDILAAIPGYASVKRLFLRAVPTLSQYMHTNAARELTVRFRLGSPLAQLSLSYLDDESIATSETSKTGKGTGSTPSEKANLTETSDAISKQANTLPAASNAVYYLGHDYIHAVCPTLNELSSETLQKNPNKLDRLDPVPLFSPRRYRAPVVMGYPSNRPDLSSRYNQDFTNTVWNIIAPFNETLQHGAKVIIKTKPMDLPTGSTDATKPDTEKPLKVFPVTMVVFRNAQGVFLPAMSNGDDVHFWRILKTGARHAGENIKEGDAVRLCWTFEDQTLGFRDFKEDVFGRRRVQKPAELRNSTLYLKLPLPRFESLLKPEQGSDPIPNTMVMSVQHTQQLAIEHFNTLPSISLRGGPTGYFLEDVSFYIDAVANDGKGDTDDYLLQGLSEDGQTDEQAWASANTKTKATIAQQKVISRLFFLEIEA